MSLTLKSPALCLIGLAAACSGPASPANERPTAAFASSCADLVCSFSDSSSDADGQIAAYRWSFGDHSSDVTTRDALHSYSAPGSYNVDLTVTDDSGATAGITHAVGAGPRIVLDPDTITVTSRRNYYLPIQVDLRISSGGSTPLQWTATAHAPWITLSATSGTTPSTVTVTISSNSGSSLSQSTITVSAQGVFNSPLTVPVTRHLQ
jgi:PKD repeat protein